MTSGIPLIAKIAEATTAATATAAADYLTKTLLTHLQAGRKVVWLVPGGSSIAVALEVAQTQRAAEESGDCSLAHLTVSLTDERYGEVGHADSNWQQLLDGGFALPGATMIPVLTGASMTKTVENFGEALTAALRQADVSIGFFGVGADGHTAGILPNSPAVRATTPTAGYDAGHYQRITITLHVIAALDEAVVYAVGGTKWPVIKWLKGLQPQSQLPVQPSSQLSPAHLQAEFPAGELVRAGKLTIFSDYKEL